jgi:hypothetical protein
MKYITLMAICIHICIDNKKSILKSLLYDNVKSNLSKNQMYLFYVKVASIDRTSMLYSLLQQWIKKNNTTLIKHFLYT